jgi:hypothetical protein
MFYALLGSFHQAGAHLIRFLCLHRSWEARAGLCGRICYFRGEEQAYLTKKVQGFGSLLITSLLLEGCSGLQAPKLILC